MLHAKDLRFGNKVLNQRGEVITVQQIHSNTVVYDTQLNVNRQTTKVSNGYNYSYTMQVVEVVKEAELQEIEPIVLTPKILEKCGFRNYVRDEWIVTCGHTHTDFDFTADGLKLRHSTPSRVTIKYVHQLQNFFYAIAGHELEIDL